MKRFLIPLLIFIVLVAFLGIGLNLDPREVPSPLIGKPAPIFSLARLDDPSKSMSPKDMLGKVWLFNVWASWCGACRDEHPLLVALSKTGIVPIYGMDYKDTRQDAQQWLDMGGNPYVANAFDVNGRVGIDYGVYGVPETYVIDKKGIIVFKQIGPITEEVLRDKILPLVKGLQTQ